MTTFYELEGWRPKPGLEEGNQEIIRTWFAFVHEHHDTLLPEWILAQCYYEVSPETGQPNGRYLINWGYRNFEAHATYHRRREGYTGPYVAYDQVHPRHYFDDATVTLSNWQAHEDKLWLDWRPTTENSFFEAVSWTPLAGVEAEHDRAVRQWFAFVEAHQAELFADWNSVHYLRGFTRNEGQPLNRYMLVTEYGQWPNFVAHQARREQPARLYADYLTLDLSRYMEQTTVSRVFCQPHEFSLWGKWK